MTQGIKDVGLTETPTKSVDINSQNQIKNMMTGKFGDVESNSNSQADGESERH